MECGLPDDAPRSVRRQTIEIGEAMARRLRAARDEAGLTVRELAERADISHQTVVTYEAGGGGVAKLDTIKAIADVLGVRPGWLAYGDGPRRKKEQEA